MSDDPLVKINQGIKDCKMVLRIGIDNEKRKKYTTYLEEWKEIGDFIRTKREHAQYDVTQHDDVEDV
jgi:hypothetical protein